MWTHGLRNFALSGLILFGLICPAQKAKASCDGLYQFEVGELETEIMRRLFLTVQSETERFFNVRLDALCLSDEEDGAYYDTRSNNLVVGIGFFEDQTNPPGNINMGIAIMAHEVAHAFQNKYALFDKLVKENKNRDKCIELHADFIAGGYMGWRSRSFNISPHELAAQYSKLGDHHVAHDRHHGLPQERYMAFRKGFETQGVDEKTLASMGMVFVYGADCDN